MTTDRFGTRAPPSLLVTTILIAALATIVLRELYFLIFPWVLSFNLVNPLEAYTATIQRWVNERDGIEIYAVYALSFAVLLITSLIQWIFDQVRGQTFIFRSFYALSLFVFLILYFVFSVRFTPPMAGDHRLGYLLLFAIFLFLLSFYKSLTSMYWELLLVGALLIPVCLISTTEVAFSNYVYMLGPAQKLLDGVPFQQIYFQYEFLISAVAAVWMWAGLSEASLQIVGQLSNYAVVLTLFYLARNLFARETLAYFLLLGLVVFRFLGAPWDPVYLFQITPLRLELWLIPFLVVYLRGPYHWLVPFACGILVLVHGALGLVYTLGYLQLLLMLGALSVRDRGWRQSVQLFLTPRAVVLVGVALAYLVACFLVARFVFSANIEATGYYQKIGIGFLPIQHSSLFWLIPIVMAVHFVVLTRIRHAVTLQYISLGFLTVFFCLGNCIYFLGRSHELNIFSICISVIFLIFFSLDACSRYISLGWAISQTHRSGNLAALAGGLLLVAMAYGCAPQIELNLRAKLDRVLSGNLYPQDGLDQAQKLVDKLDIGLAEVLPANSRVQFLTYDEVNEYVFYKGPQNNQSFFYPLAAWVFVDPLVSRVRELLQQGVYLLLDSRVSADLTRAGLNPGDYAYRSSIGNYLLIGLTPPKRQ